ncbi:sensor histidine kinase [Cesiribacter sp. SM1]|uniref:sensor histidine kinase n=1 Tax=Cesiribacter sp. SM1 TaxID=2861196 RepID=UPI001CD63E36|nr:sensor histidine kinase [Cesiribacter sp. SM1]
MSANLQKAYFANFSFLCFIQIWLLFLILPFTLVANQAPQVQALDTAKALSQFTLDNWQMEDGLPSNSVMAHLKSKSGYFWLATYDGLSRFDGYKFKNYTQRFYPQIPTNSLFDLHEDVKGNLWIATNGGGVVKMRDEVFTVIQENEFSPNQSVTAFAEDEQGQIWVGTRGGLGLIRDDVFVAYPELNRLHNLHIFSLYHDAKGSLWIGTVGDGLWELHNGLLRHYTNIHGLTNNSIRSIFEDQKGRLWIGTEEGINIMEHGRIREVPVFGKTFAAFINDIHQDAYGTLWFTTNEGLLRYKKNTFEWLLTDTEGGSNELQQLYSDGEGSLWIGSYYKGLLRLRDGKFNNYSRAEGLPNEVVNVVWSEEDAVWVGTNDGVAFLKQGVEQVYRLDNNSAANRVREIFRDSRGVLWVGTNDGIFRLKGNKFERAFKRGSGLSSDKIRRIVEDKEGRLWIGTRNGLFVSNPERPEEVRVVDELYGIFILSLFVDSKGNLWVATNGKGLYYYDGTSFSQHSYEQGLTSNVLFDVWEDKEGIIWVGSNDGLHIYKNNSWHNINEKQGLFVNTIFQILNDEQDNLWLTTNRGVFVVKRSEILSVTDNKNAQFRNYKQFTTADGMRSSEIAAVSRSCLSSDGLFWFATLNGVSAINPKLISTNPTSPLVKIERVTGDKYEYPLASEVRFAAGTKQYEIQYTGFNYYAPKATSFYYMLDGFDKEWQEAGNRRVAYYTNLPAGDYTFKVRATNEDGIWSKEEAAFKIIQEAYYYENPWFKVAMLCLVVLLLVVLYFWRTRQLRLENLKLESLINERTNDITAQKESIEHQKEELSRLNQLKDKLLSVLSHDLRQPFSSISGLLALLRERQIDQQEFQHFSKELNQQVKWQVHMLDNVLLWTRNQLKGLEVKPVAISLYQTIEEILILYRSQANFKNITIENKVLPDTIIVADADILHLVMRNLIGNAVKFTNNSGTITVSARFARGYYQIEVSDNGIGMNKAKLDKLFVTFQDSPERGTSNEKGSGLGLALCHEFIEACGGRIWAESRQGMGSRFIFTLPEKGSSHTNTGQMKQPALIH